MNDISYSGITCPDCGSEFYCFSFPDGRMQCEDCGYWEEKVAEVREIPVKLTEKEESGSD